MKAAERVGMKLNLACGGSRWPGFENSDIHPDADYQVDLERFPYPYESGSAEIVMMSHALFMAKDGEPFHPDLARIMGECYRILAPKGWLRIDDNPLRCWLAGEYVESGERAVEAQRGYPDELRISRDDLHRILWDASFRTVTDVPQGETNIPCEPETREAILGNRLGHVSFTVEAQK